MACEARAAPEDIIILCKRTYFHDGVEMSADYVAIPLYAFPSSVIPTDVGGRIYGYMKAGDHAKDFCPERQREGDKGPLQVATEMLDRRPRRGHSAEDV